MSLKNRFFLVSLLILLAVPFAIWVAPFTVSNGVRLWVWWKARHEGLIVSIDKIEAPFLRPVTIRGLQVKSAPDNAFLIDLTVRQVSLNLNLKGILLGMRARHSRSFDSRITR